MYRLGYPHRYDDPAKAMTDMAVQANALRGLASQVYLDDKFVGMATSLGHGYFVASYDNIFGLRMGRAENPPGTITLRNPYSATPIRIKWSVELPFRPLLLMRAADDHTLSPIFMGAQAAIGTMAEMLATEYVKMWRFTYRLHFDPPEPDGLPYIVEGYSIYPVELSTFRCGSDDLQARTPRSMACFDYPSRLDYGAPAVLADGRLVAVIIGNDSEDVRATLIPVELINPFRDLWRMREDKFAGKFSSQFYFSVHHHSYN